jgi:hypothetical protein
MHQRLSAAVLAAGIVATSPCLAQSRGAATPATAKPASPLLFQPLRLDVDVKLAPWVAAFDEKEHAQPGSLSLLAAEDGGSRSGQTQGQGDYTLFGRDLTLQVTQFAAGAWNGLPLWMTELVFHIARPADRKRTESTFVVGVVGRSNVPAAPLFSYRLSW